MKPEARPHISVMMDEMLEHFADVQLKTFYEGTLGAGGHAKALLESHPEIELYIGCDRDPDALAIAEKTLAPWKKKVRFIQGDYSDLDKHCKKAGVKNVDGFFLTWEFHRCS